MRQAYILTITVALVLSGLATNPANASTDYDGSNGIVNCVDDGSVTGSGSYVIELNVVTSNSECTGRAVIPSGVTSIGMSAFRYSNLSSIVIPATVVSIDSYAMSDVYSLKTVSFTSDSQLASIGPSAFSGSGITRILLPESVTSIGISTFEGTSKLTAVKFAGTSSLVSIGESAFRYSNLSSIVIPANVISIGNFAFESAYKLVIVRFASMSQLTTIGEAAFKGSRLSSIVIPAGVTNIGDSAFLNTSNLVSFSVEPGNTSFVEVDNVLFTVNEKTLVAYPAGFTSANYTIPESVTSIGGGAFAGSAILERFGVAEGNTEFVSVDHVLFGADGTALLAYPTGSNEATYTIPANVTSISNYAFYGGSYLTSILFAGSSQLTAIGDAAFLNTSLTSMAFPASLTTIGNSAFSGLYALKSVTFASPSQLTSIGSGAFQYSGITSIVIPASVTSIGASSFEGAQSLSAVTFASPSRLTSIGNYAFSSTPSISSVNIPFGVTLIGFGLFQSSGIASISIPESVTSIAAEAFQGAMRLTTIIFLGSIDAGSVDKGSILLPNLGQDGYTFSGWYSDANFTTNVGDAYSLFNVTQPTSLFAKLTKKAEATTKPSITGTAVVSKTLTANKGVWTGYPVPTIGLRWYSCTAPVGRATATIPSTCKAITGATKPTLAITKSLKGKYLAVLASGQSAGTTATRWLSKTTAKVK